MFDPCQPDLNWHHADVHERFENILRFWLDRGVDGFRIDVAHGLFKAPGLPDPDSATIGRLAGISQKFTISIGNGEKS